MKSAGFDDETLMAFADGELDEATAAAIEAAIERDDTLKKRVALFAETRRRVKAEFASHSTLSVPPALEASIRALAEQAGKPSAAASGRADTRVVPLDEIRRSRVQPWVLPLAASLAAAIIAGGVGYQFGAQDQAGPLVAGPSTPAVVAALDTLASGDERALAATADRIRLVASFRDAQGHLCREYEITDSVRSLVGVSCREDAGWKVRIAIASAADAGGFSPASALDAVETYLSAIGAGSALSPDEEKQALEAGR